MAILSINWRSLNEVAPQAATTGESAEEAKASMRAEKPMLIYITSDDPTDSATVKLEQIIFAQEKVGLGVKFFDTIKISQGDASQDRMLGKYADNVPGLVFVSRDYEVTDSLSGKITAGKMLKAMKALAKKEYVNNFEKMVRDYTKLLNERDRLESKKALIADQRRRLQEKPNKSRAKKLDREEKEFEADMEKWRDAEKKLLEFRFKGDEKAEA